MLRIVLVRENGNGKFYLSKVQALLFSFAKRRRLVRGQAHASVPNEFENKHSNIKNT